DGVEADGRAPSAAATGSAPGPVVPPHPGPGALSAPGPGASRRAASRGTIYLAETTSDVREQREALRRDLLQHGYQVLPDHPLPHVADEAGAAIREQLARSRMSIHLIGRHYGLVPEGGELSLIETQHELATARGQDSDFSRLIWIPDGLQVQDERQRRVLDRLRVDPRIGDGADLLETYFEDLRTAVQDWLTRPRPAAAPPEPSRGSAEPARVYLIADERDVATLDPWADALFDEGFEVIRPVYDGDEREIREYHEENLASCDGVVIFYGSGNELWLRRKLRELQKAAGYGRTKAPPTVGICLIGARTAEKERFRTHEATVVPQWDGADMDVLRPLVAAIKARGVA
ncbi:MAG: DUF4062 domain-containing protein, partial [Acidobacteriota bacterium]|nr:DUF4062 domain-containing protein [Acidobacteriota bacterium]